MAEPIFSVSGLRGIVGESLSPGIAIRYACALAAELPPGPIVITRDGRTTGPMLAAAVTGGLTAVGRNVIDAGIAATPTTGVLVRQYQAIGGIQITASHNPREYNGIKLFSGAGRVIRAPDGQRVLERYRQGRPAWVGHEAVGRIETCIDSIGEHLKLVLAIVDVPRIRKLQLKVVLDSNHGAGSLLGRRLLEELGCQVTLIGGEPDGQYEHVPEPTANNLAGVLKRVPKAGAHVGFCQDPDADRLAVIDEKGRYLGEEYTLAICVDHVLRGLTQAGEPDAKPLAPVVTNCSTSRMTEDLANKYGAKFFRSAVGEANVVDKILANKGMLGGEGNGGVIDLRVGPVRDSFVGMALILDAMVARQMKVSGLAAELPRYAIVKDTIPVPLEKLPDALDALEKHFSDAKPDRLDGLRLDWPDKWLLVRPSNTEPIVRLFAEARSAIEARPLCEETDAVLASL